MKTLQTVRSRMNDAIRTWLMIGLGAMLGFGLGWQRPRCYVAQACLFFTSSPAFGVTDFMAALDAAPVVLLKTKNVDDRLQAQQSLASNAKFLLQSSASTQAVAKAAGENLTVTLNVQDQLLQIQVSGPTADLARAGVQALIEHYDNVLQGSGYTTLHTEQRELSRRLTELGEYKRRLARKLESQTTAQMRRLSDFKPSRKVLNQVWQRRFLQEAQSRLVLEELSSIRAASRQHNGSALPGPPWLTPQRWSEPVRKHDLVDRAEQERRYSEACERWKEWSVRCRFLQLASQMEQSRRHIVEPLWVRYESPIPKLALGVVVGALLGFLTAKFKKSDPQKI